MNLDQYQEGDIIEPEEWRNPEQQSFNHQGLVMKGIQKSLDLGSKELREGWWDEKVDKMGNVRRTYNEDTRKCFIESVKSLLMVVTCDFDEAAKEKIVELQNKIGERKNHWLNEEWNWWNSLNPVQKNHYLKEGKVVVKGFFNKKLDFDNYFYDEEVNLYRDICTEISNLTKRLDFYGEIGYTA